MHHDGRPSGREAAGVAAHLRGCARCGRLRDEMISLEREVRATVGGAWDPSPPLRHRVIDHWLAERMTYPTAGRQVHFRHSFHPAARSCLLVISTAAALLAAGQLVRRQPSASDKRHNRQIVRTDRPERRVLIPRLDLPAAADHPGRSDRRQPATRSAEEQRILAVLPHDDRRKPSPALHRPAGSAGDLDYWRSNPETMARLWAGIRQDEWEKIENRVRQAIRPQDDFIRIPFPRIAAISDHAIVAATEAYKREAAIIDPRLSREVTCAFKGTALSDLCDQLRAETGIQLSAGPSVADEKVTLFCEKSPLREVLRQLSRPFGYTWLRSGRVSGTDEPAPTPETRDPRPSTGYRYELVQDLRSQLLEEELRNRDRNAALLALERDIEAFRPYLDLSPDEARERAKSAGPEEKKRLEVLAGLGWGPIQMYFQLTPQQQAALRAGQTLKFGQRPDAGEEPLPAEIALGVRESRRDLLGPTGPEVAGEAQGESGPPSATGTAAGDARARRIVDDPDAQAVLTLRLDQSELGRFTLDGTAGVRLAAGGGAIMGNDGPYAGGSSPTVERPDNAVVNAGLVHDPALQGRVTVKPVASSQWSVASGRSEAFLATGHPPASRVPALTTDRKLTSADVLEALHRATGLPIVADFYTRLYPSGSVTEKDQPLFVALNHLSDAMRLRWAKEAGGWLQFRSTSYYDDRQKEVPNRLLARWAAARRSRGALGLDDLIEIAGLTDAQLDAASMAEGARECWGLEEWFLARGREQRPHLRFLAQLTPAQRQEAQSAAGLAFTRLTLAQMQQLLPMALGPELGRLGSIQAVTEGAVRVELARAGGFEWHAPEEPGGVAGGPDGPPPVHGPTPEAALAAARRVDPRATAAQIVPSALVLTFQYTWGGATARPFTHVVRVTDSGVQVSIQMGGSRPSGG